MADKQLLNPVLICKDFGGTTGEAVDLLASFCLYPSTLHLQLKILSSVASPPLSIPSMDKSPSTALHQGHQDSDRAVWSQWLSHSSEFTFQGAEGSRKRATALGFFPLGRDSCKLPWDIHDDDSQMWGKLIWRQESPGPTENTEWLCCLNLS